MGPPPTLSGLLARAAPERDPSEALPAIVELRSHLDELEALHVVSASQSGWSWAKVADALGVSKQAAHRKHAERLKQKPAPAPPPVTAPRVLVTGEARHCVRLAREEARALGRPTVGTEHLLLGLMHGSGPAAKALEALGMTLDEARAALEPTLVDEEPPDGEVGAEAVTGVWKLGDGPGGPAISPLARAVLEQSLRETVDRGDGYLAVHHLLLAVVRDDRGGACRTLRHFGVERDAVREELDRIVSPGVAPTRG